MSTAGVVCTTLAPARPIRVTGRIFQTELMTASVAVASHTDEAGAVDKGVDGEITHVTQARLGEVGEAAKAAQARRSTRGRETK